MNILQKQRLSFRALIPKGIKKLREVSLLQIPNQHKENSILESLFPLTYSQGCYHFVPSPTKISGKLRLGVFFSGGQAPGGHNVIAGIWDALQEIDPESMLCGFLGGPSGVVDAKYRELRQIDIDQVRNMGGFDLLGSGRTKIETPEQISAAMETCQHLRLDGLVVIGGDDSNTNAAILAEAFLAKGCETKVIGIPKTIDGDLQSEAIEISFGFDSACKTYSELIGNIGRDALSAKKYYHFIKLMGRSASHIALECAIATHPNLCFIGEERKGLSLIVQEIADLVEKRSHKGKEYGIILIPEGLIEFMPEMKILLDELNRGEISSSSQAVFESLPEKIQKQLTQEKDPHGNVALSQIETEVLLIEKVKEELKKRTSYKGKFSPVPHFFGYEGRACYPSNFDATYCTVLGRLAALAVRDGATGVIASVQHLTDPVENWDFRLIPLVEMMHLEERKGKQKPVIKKTLVDLEGASFRWFAARRKEWELADDYQNPGPIQFFGGADLTDTVPEQLRLRLLRMP